MGGVRDRKKVQEISQNYYLPQTPLQKAVNKGSVECVNALIKYGADITSRNVRERVKVRE